MANGGTLYRPYLVERVVSPDERVIDSFTPTALRTAIADEAILRVVQQGMREAVEYGTAVELRDHPGRIAAKTGTAETGDDDRIHAWFTAFAPYEDPEIAVAVFVEEGGSGSEAALPVAEGGV